MAAVSIGPDTAARLLDFGQPLDVALLDATVAAFYGAGSNEEVRLFFFFRRRGLHWDRRRACAGPSPVSTPAASPLIVWRRAYRRRPGGRVHRLGRRRAPPCARFLFAVSLPRPPSSRLSAPSRRMPRREF